MDIRKWGLDRIMQLPDGCFGRRWPIIFSGTIVSGAKGYFISELALPERSVIWQLFFWCPAIGGLETFNLSIFAAYAIGDQLPSAAIWPTLEPLFQGVDRVIIPTGAFYAFTGVLNMKVPVMTSGRRICLRVQNSSTISLLCCSGLVISSVPNEVPDCLLSA